MKAGFTFLELLVVLMLMAVLTAVVTPALGGLYKSVAVDSSARRVMAVFQEAKGAALRGRGKVQVSINPAANTFKLISREGDKAETLLQTVIEDTVIESIKVDGEFKSLSSEVSIDIYPMMVRKGAVISLKGPNGKVNDVILHAGGGRIAVE